MAKHTLEKQDLNDLGFNADLAMWLRSPLDRRRILRMGAMGIGVLLAGCTIPAPTVNNAAMSNTAATSSATAGCLSEIPSETAGPYPADGSNASNAKLNVLDQSGIVRSDIRTSLTTKHVAGGVPLTVEMTLVNTNDDCKPLAGYAIYAWHCTREGGYSMYSEGLTDEDFLRGIQATSADGKVMFASVFPGCYMGRWPHIHFEVYETLAKATSSNNVVHTSQMALPEDVCKTVYATEGYENSVRNLSRITLATDNIFSDGYAAQMATVTGDMTNGYTAKLTVGIAV